MIGEMPAGYDAWKTRSGYDERDTFPSYDDEPEEECDHEEYEHDIISGRAVCCKCPHSWYLSAEEIAAEIERIRAYDEWQREQDRPWFRFKRWAESHIGAIRSRWKRWRRPAPVIDDEIPF